MLARKAGRRDSVFVEVGSGVHRKGCGWSWGRRQASGDGGAARSGKKMPARTGTQEGGCISNDLLKKSLNVVPRDLCVLIFGSVQ